MPGENHFEIFPERYHLNHEGTGPVGPTGYFMYKFVFANGEVGPISMQKYRDRTDANRGVHDFMSAINRDHPHPPIIDVEE